MLCRFIFPFVHDIESSSLLASLPSLISFRHFSNWVCADRTSSWASLIKAAFSTVSPRSSNRVAFKTSFANFTSSFTAKGARYTSCCSFRSLPSFLYRSWNSADSTSSLIARFASSGISRLFSSHSTRFAYHHLLDGSKPRIALSAKSSNSSDRICVDSTSFKNIPI